MATGASGDVAVEFTTSERTTAKMAGLSNGDDDQNFEDIDFAVYLRGDGTALVYEAGRQRFVGGGYSAGDVFRVEVVSGQVRYRHNGDLLYISLAAPTYPLGVDTSFFSAGATVTDVTFVDSAWENDTGVAISGSDLTKTANDGWGNAGATTVKSVPGDGYLEFTTAENNTYKMAGLSNGNADAGFEDIDFAFYLKGDGNLEIYEFGALRERVGTYAAGDAFRVQASGDTVTYRHNGALVHTSRTTPRHPLLVDTALFTNGATITNATLADGFWDNTVGVSVLGARITKTTADPAWDAGATTTASIAADGYVEFSTTDTITYKMAGLANGNTNSGFEDIDFAFHMRGDAVLQVYEAGALTADVGTYAAGDRFRIEVAGGAVRYLVNGGEVHVSTRAPTAPLLLDTALYSRNAAIHDVVIANSP